ncbi:MAG TPA: pyridoxamine 5'-phosphate oxidase family protein [Patescibacteria group bacterium]|nr:pyridoxamine 5'-phosphate oxidase family protein [Patescibacteria group bacterium]
MDIKQLITEYLESARLMQVATAKDNQPWVCTVYFAYDDKLNLYWLSKPERRHSQEIAINEKVAGTIVLPHTPGDEVRGIQFQGIAKKLEKQDGEHGLKTYATRMKMGEERKKKIQDGTDGHMVYHIKPTLFVLFDEKNFPDNPRQEYKM